MRDPACLLVARNAREYMGGVQGVVVVATVVVATANIRPAATTGAGTGPATVVGGGNASVEGSDICTSGVS